MKYQNSLAFAKALDRADPLKSFRTLFHIPKIDRKQSLYFTGNSLGLQPKSTKRFITEELNDWAKLGVEGHFHAKRPWYYYHKFSKKALAHLVGAKPSEVVAMNQLTVNLQLMMVSFYRPSGKRFKIITEAGAFSSDQYAFESQVNLRSVGEQVFRREEAIVELQPRPGEFSLRTEDILRAIEEHRDQLALVIFGAVQYYSGQFFTIKAITEAGHQAGAVVGFDLAHAIGNVPLNLHVDDVDFAVWCSYKYLNSGPGGVGGAFVHERHGNNFDLPRLAGWWGHDEKDRFQMKKGFRPMPGVDGWQLSNFPVISGAAHLASLEIFERAGMKSIHKKSILLTGYLEFLLNEMRSDQFHIITPSNPGERGCQVSILMKQNGKKVFNTLTKDGVVADWREPDVIRVAPVPLYNTFEEVYRFAEIFKNALGVT
ncbi:MAG TPA: kynureninase [Cyclobacteriaceae bacterium]|nr:kynureninase [Cyclobacteriaceae bacterium]